MVTQHTIETDELADELPTQWDVEHDGRSTVHGYARGYSSGAHSAGPGEVPASFSVERVEGDIWIASWSEPNGLRGGLHGPVDDITGVKERVIEWVVDKAVDLDEDQTD